MVVLSLVLTITANAASTIGTNMSTTGTFTVTPASDSATSVRFQDTAGTNYFVADSTNFRIGIGAAPSTTFEVQGTASASYFFTQNTIQIAGVPGATASVAYSRFGTGTTGHSLAATDDVLFSGLVEFDDNAFFDAKVGIGAGPSTTFEVQGTASASYFFTQNTIQVAGVPGATASVAYSRFGTGTTGHATDIDASNDLLLTGGIEVNGNSFFDGKASVASNFQMSGRFIADTTASHSMVGDLILTSALTVGATTASSSNGNGYTAEFVGPTTSTASFYFGSAGVTGTKGTCFQLKDTTGAWIYMRFANGTTTPTLSTTRCH